MDGIRITQEEIKRLLLANVNDRPNAVASYGQAKMTPQQTKELFDRQFQFMAERFNRLLEAAVLENELPDALPNPNKLIINGVEYDGSHEVTMEIKGGEGVDFEVGSGLILEPSEGEKPILRVDTADDAEKDNTRPITSAAVYTEIGNIEAILLTI